MSDLLCGTCITHWKMEMKTTFLSENLEGRDHLGELGTDVRIMLKMDLKVTEGRLVTSDSGYGPVAVLLKTVTNFRFPKKREIS